MFGHFETKLLRNWVYPIVNLKRIIQYLKIRYFNSELKNDLNKNINFKSQ